MHRSMVRLSQLMAYTGGLVLTALMILTCFSVLGRALSNILYSDFMQSHFEDLSNTLLSLGIGPVKGDFELIEAGMAFVIFAFLPICHITSGHAVVDVLTSKMPKYLQNSLCYLSDILFACVFILITLQLYQGMASKMASSQTSFLLEFPVWWAYALSIPGAAIASLIACYIALSNLWRLVTQHSFSSHKQGIPLE